MSAPESKLTASVNSVGEARQRRAMVPADVTDAVLFVPVIDPSYAGDVPDEP
jgi:hypothetical protein